MSLLLKLAVETWLAPAVFIYLHEATQYVLLESEVELKLEGGYVVLEPRGGGSAWRSSRAPPHLRQ